MPELRAFLHMDLDWLTPETQPRLAFWDQRFLQKYKFLPRLLSLGLNALLETPRCICLLAVGEAGQGHGTAEVLAAQ